jgi:hypothetical protein
MLHREIAVLWIRIGFSASLDKEPAFNLIADTGLMKLL